MEDDTAVRYEQMGYSDSSEEDLVAINAAKNGTLRLRPTDDEQNTYDRADPTLDNPLETVPENSQSTSKSSETETQRNDIGKKFDSKKRSLKRAKSDDSDSELRARPREQIPEMRKYLLDLNNKNEPDLRNRNKRGAYLNRGFSEDNTLRRRPDERISTIPDESEEVELRSGRFSVQHTPEDEEYDSVMPDLKQVAQPNRPQSMTAAEGTNRRVANMTRSASSFSLPAEKYQVSSDGQKMVLQLVLPQSGLDNPKHEPPITPDYIQYELFQPRKGYNDSNSSSQPDLFPRPGGQQFEYGNRGLGLSSSEIGIPDRSQLTVTSLGGVSGALDEEDPPPTSHEDKIKMFRGYLTVILSCVYAVFIVTLGLVVYVSDIVLQDGVPLAESFSIYLVVLGLLYFAFLYADIRRYMNKVKSRNALLINKDDNSSKDSSIACHTAAGNIHLSIPLPSKLAEDPLPHHYCFSKGRHSGSFYLKIGAAGFCFGHLIHSGLMLGYQIVYLTEEGEEFYNCASIPTLVLDILYPIYSFLQLFFIFKYSNVMVNRCKELARFALMHCIASSICFWIWTIMRETLDSLNSYAHYKEGGSDDDGSHEEVDSLENSIALPLTFNQQMGARNLLNCLNETSWWMTGQCKPPEGLYRVASQFSPYLYPFTIEYSILVVGILYIIWQNIGNCNQNHGGDTSECLVTTSDGTHSNLVIHADCHSANKGLFAGIIVLVASVVSIILFFIAMADQEYINMGLMVNAISELILLILMTVSVIFAYRKLTQLDINHHPISLLDDLLLFICIPAFFMYGIFSIIPAILKNNGLSITITILQVIQVLLQTPFIIDGLRRCSNTRQLRLKKPGRELVTFLVVCNVAMWITETFEIKSHDKRDDRYDVYGKVLWTLLGHMTVPLTMFYRFHSSVCLVDIWNSAYERGELGH